MLITAPTLLTLTIVLVVTLFKITFSLASSNVAVSFDSRFIAMYTYAVCTSASFSDPTFGIDAAIWIT